MISHPFRLQPEALISISSVGYRYVNIQFGHAVLAYIPLGLMQPMFFLRFSYFALENETRYNVHKLSPVTLGRKENPNEKEYPDKTVFPNRRLYPVVHNIPLYTKEQQANLSSLSYFVL